MIEKYLSKAYAKRQSEINEILSEWSLSAGNLIRQKQGKITVPYITVHILKRLMIALDVAQLIDDHLMSSVKEPNAPEQEPKKVIPTEAHVDANPEDVDDLDEDGLADWMREPMTDDKEKLSKSWFVDTGWDIGDEPGNTTVRYLPCEDHT